jgi:hypothetical protein
MTRASTPRARALRNHVRAAIHPDHGAAQRRQPCGQHTVATAEIEDALARVRRKQVDDRHAQLRDEAGMRRVTLGLPVLGDGRRLLWRFRLQGV